MTRTLPSSRGHWARVFVSATLFLALAGAAAAEEPDIQLGEQIFHLCGTCHGSAGEGNADRSAPQLAGLPSWYLDAQLEKFVAGIRAYHADDVAGLQMKPMARYVSAETRRNAVVAYIATLEPVRSESTLGGGDAQQGQALYATCSACHGADAKGMEALKAPALVHQSDWYLSSQIHKFKNGLRGTQKADVTGSQMRAMALTLVSDQAVQDVVAYIRSLGEEH